ncbi:histidine phosphatase family protein [Streptomyces sp. NPDC048182]|uniref:histidine phosphatase family protein n=1 Tax=Streptomyces sp. NPDC048182 TaxID=3365507 RepID=UPI0037152DEC
MTCRVTLVTPAMNDALRRARFDDGTNPLDAGGATAARAAAGSLPAAARAVVSPGVRCRETATALGLAEAREEAALSGLRVGRWRGLTLDQVGAAEPAAVAEWLADPDAAPHGGEPVRELCLRVGRWLDALAREDGRVVAVVEPDVVRAAVAHALGAPAAAFWRVDAPPLTATELSGRSGRWNLRSGIPLRGPAAG